MEGGNKEKRAPPGGETSAFHETIHPERRLGGELFKGTGGRSDLTVLDFWQWSASGLLTNVQRRRLAEYLVWARDVDDEREATAGGGVGQVGWAIAGRRRGGRGKPCEAARGGRGRGRRPR